MIKVLLDTDIGTDVDDAVALAYLLSHPDCELLGITTVTGEANKRAPWQVWCAKRPARISPSILAPSIPCRESSASQSPSRPLPCQPGRMRHCFLLNQAVDFLANTIRTHPGEVILLTIGPLTNAGLLFNTFPDVAELLKGFVMMGGNFGEHTANERVEWNIAGDPLASQITYKAPVRLHRSLGLNVTQQVMMSPEVLRKRFLHRCYGRSWTWLRSGLASFIHFITFHDPLAAATIFAPELCTLSSGYSYCG